MLAWAFKLAVVVNNFGILQVLQQQQAAVAVVGPPMTQNTAGPGPGQPSQRVFTGTVTKLHDNFGFVDDDVFFQTSTVKGDMPRIHDRYTILSRVTKVPDSEMKTVLYI